MIKIIIADDVEILRNGLKTIIEQDSEIEVCGLASDGNETFRLCKELSPDLILMDMSMPVCDGATATKMIKENYSQIKVLVLTTFDDSKTVNEALASGADGYILKSVDEKKLTHAIKSAVSDINVFETTVFNKIKKNNPKPNLNLLNITPREKEIIILVAQGLSNKDIAKQLYLSDGTVRNIISNLLYKLDLKDRTQLAVFAVKNDLY
ncbi:MAG: response regulator transcription factor [Acutalibacteraceae bacterium]|nr:response regulator transcription factor [Acutalibacteraceae bacterium]